MKKYIVKLSQEERDSLSEIILKGSHRSQKVLNALILLNCDEGSFQDDRTKNEEIARVLKISMRKIDRLKKRFVEEGLDIALDTRGKGARKYERRVDGDFEAHLIS
ncbi:MAG: helix-turn-helix domain-containing protein, partial [Desulfobacteraceae bacterium]|nr:helix-turn-helix domain-containing protein [Desulfobacteraceae bacterium]